MYSAISRHFKMSILFSNSEDLILEEEEELEKGRKSPIVQQGEIPKLVFNKNNALSWHFCNISNFIMYKNSVSHWYKTIHLKTYVSTPYLNSESETTYRV